MAVGRFDSPSNRARSRAVRSTCWATRAFPRRSRPRRRNPPRRRSRLRRRRAIRGPCARPAARTLGQRLRHRPHLPRLRRGRASSPRRAISHADCSRIICVAGANSRLFIVAYVRRESNWPRLLRYRRHERLNRAVDLVELFLRASVERGDRFLERFQLASEILIRR